MAFGLQYLTGLIEQQAAQDVFIDGGEAGDGGKLDVFVDLVDALIHWAKLDKFVGNGFDKTAIRCAAAGGEGSLNAALLSNGCLSGLDEAAGFGNEGLAGELPLEAVVQMMLI